MKYLVYYIADYMLYFAIFTAITLLIRKVFVNKNKHINAYHEAGVATFFGCVGGIASQTVASRDFGVYTGAGQFIFIPFYYLYYSAVSLKDTVMYNYDFFVNFMGNIFVFLPVGFVMPLVWRVKAKNVIITGCLMSVFIEVFQIFTERVTDINDIMLNTLGTAIGYGLYLVLTKNRKAFSDKFKTARN